MSKRFSTEAPGPLAEAEAAWLLAEKGVEITAAQVRAVLNFHGEFQRSDARKAQREALLQERAARDEQRKADREAKEKAKAEREAERLRRAEERVTNAKARAEAAKERAEKAAEKAVAVEAKAREQLAKAAVESDGKVQPAETPEPAKRTTRRSKASSEAVSA